MLQPREQQRRRVLREMGITPWFPQDASPTAGRSHDVIFSCAESVERDQTTGAPASVAAKASDVAQALQLDKKQRQNPEQQAVVAKAESGEVPGSDEKNSDSQDISEGTLKTEPVAFNFTWVTVDDRLALLAMMPEAETRIPAAQRDMMKRMLVALDPGIDTSNLKARLFSWPMPGLASQDSAAATSAVNGFVAKQLNDRPVANLLVLSSSLPVFLPSSTQIGQFSAWEPFKVEVLYTRAMHEMVDSPSTKRQAWQHMQILRQRLTTG